MTFSIDVDLSDHYIALPENYVDLSDNYVDLSDIKLISRWQLAALTWYENKIFSYNVMIFFWKVDIMIWQVDIKNEQVIIRIWQVDIIISQVMAKICHHSHLTDERLQIKNNISHSWLLNSDGSLWHGTSVLNGHLRGTVTLKPVAERLALKLSTCFDYSSLSQPGFEPWPPAC